MSVGVDTGRDEHVHRHHPATFADLEHEGVGGDERVRTRLFQAAGAELLHVLIELGGHHRDLRPGQAGDAQGLHELVHPPGRDAQQVAGRHHAGQRPLGPPAPLQQPLRVQAALAQRRDRDIHSPDAGVQVAVSVAVAGVDPLAGAFAVAGPAHRVGLSRQQRVDERGQQIPHQVRARLRELLVQEAGRVDTGYSGHRCGSFFESVSQITRRIHPVAAPTLEARAHSGPSYTTLLDSTRSSPQHRQVLHFVEGA